MRLGAAFQSEQWRAGRAVRRTCGHQRASPIDAARSDGLGKNLNEPPRPKPTATTGLTALSPHYPTKIFTAKHCSLDV